MIIEAIHKLTNKENLTTEEVTSVMDELMTGKASSAQIGSYLTALHMKGETIDEITASALGMRKHCTKITPPLDVIDIVGTGGDCAHSINISTIAAIITAAAGGHVAKHGNRAASSKCGTADVLETLGVNLMLEPEKNLQVLNDCNLCFLFAQKYHSAMRYVGAARKEIKIPTIFNILGPLANPASANLQLLGVYDARLVEPLAHVLSNLNVKRGMVVYGTDGLDEISIGAPTMVCEFNEGSFYSYELTPEQFGMKRGSKQDLTGGDPDENAAFARKILSGELTGSKTDAVLLNAGAALHITNQISITEGIELARKMIRTGKAIKELDTFIALTH